MVDSFAVILNKKKRSKKKDVKIANVKHQEHMSKGERERSVVRDGVSSRSFQHRCVKWKVMFIIILK